MSFVPFPNALRFRRSRLFSPAVPLCAAAGMTFGAGAAMAQATVGVKTVTLDPVAVTAARGPQPVAELLADLTVIDAGAIARAGVESLTELLQRQPGVEVVRNGGPGAVSGVFLRGANRGQTLVLVDGVRVASASAGATTLEAIPLDQIERIEILRGPASGLYGADAIGGVVQVFTHRPTGGFQGNASAGGGTYGTASANGGIAGSAGPLRFSLQGGAKRSSGFNAIVNPEDFSYNPDRDGYRNDSVTASAALPFATDQELSAQYVRNRLDAQFDAGPEFDDRTITILETWQVASRNRLAPFWVSRVSAAQGVDDSTSKTGIGEFPFRTRQRQYTWQNEFALPRGTLTAGFERREERLATDAPFAVTGRDTDAIFGIYQLRYEAHALQANLRRDDSSQYGGRTTGALAYGYRVLPDLRLTAGYGTAFKVPSFNDLYYPGFSTPSLAPETARNVEIGAYWNGAAAGSTYALRGVAYRNRVRELIVFQCDANFICAPQNVGRATLSGVTLGAEAQLASGGTLSVSLDLQSPEDDDTGNLLPRRARRHGTVTFAHPLGPVRAGFEFVAASRRYDDAANSRPLGGYAVVNLTADWQIAKAWTAFVRADNVLDRDYELAAGYATGGATWFAGLRWQP